MSDPVYSRASVVAAYQRTRDAGIEHDQALRAVAQSMALAIEAVSRAVGEHRETADA